MLVFDGLEAKYDLKLNREYKIMKNRKAMGTLQMQNVRSKSKPVIMEMDPVMAQLEHEHLRKYICEIVRINYTFIEIDKSFHKNLMLYL